MKRSNEAIIYMDAMRKIMNRIPILFYLPNFGMITSLDHQLHILCIDPQTIISSLIPGIKSK